MIQREVGERAAGIADYLRHNDQRFFGSLIVAAYDGQPRFLPVSFEGNQFLPRMDERMGFLVFDGTEKYYALDGQHRLWAMKEENRRDPSRYQNDQISVIVICHSRNTEGMARARRLFTTLNRYAKPTARATNIAMDEDDGVYILTRRLIREHPLFQRRIKVLAKAHTPNPTLAKGDSMGKGDSLFLMAIGTFTKCNNRLLPSALRPAFDKPHQAPSFDELEAGFLALKERWDGLIAAIPLWASFKEPDNKPGALRLPTGGHVLVRPVAIASFAEAMGAAFEQGIDVESKIPAVLAQHSELNAPPWRGVIWNATTGRMVAGHDSETLSGALWRYLFGLPVDQANLEASWKSRVDPLNEHPGLHLPPAP